MNTQLEFDHALVGARILWRHWLKDQSDVNREGYMQEFSPNGTRVRISKTALPVWDGDWHEVGAVRRLETLELCCVQRIERETREAAELAAAKRQKKRRKSDDDGTEGEIA